MIKILKIALRSFQAIRRFVAGHKTYALVILSIVYAYGVERGWWLSDITIWTALGGSTAIAVRAACVRLLVQFLDDMTKASAVQP